MLTQEAIGSKNQLITDQSNYNSVKSTTDSNQQYQTRQQASNYEFGKGNRKQINEESDESDGEENVADQEDEDDQHYLCL